MAADTFAPASDVTDSPDENTLSNADRRYVWDIEHVALVLDVHVFPKMARAIRDRNLDALAEHLSDDFAGQVPGEGAGQLVQFPFGQFRHVSSDEGVGPAADRQQFLSYLMECRDEFATEPKVEMRLMRLSPVERTRLDGPWRGTLKIRLAGEQPAGAPYEIEL